MEDEDDIPIAELMRRRALEKAAEKLAQQPPPSQPPKPSAMQQHKSSAPPSTVPRRSIADDDDEEDDIPIAELMRRKAASSSVLAVTVKPSPSKSVQPPIKMKHPKEVHVKEEKKDKKEKKEKKDRDRDRERDRDRHSSKHEDRHKSSTSSSSRPSSGGNAAKTKSGIIYEESTKGALVQKLLVRWWYAIEWPKAGEVEDAPAGFEALDGFPGVFVSTRVDSLGKILDLRNTDTCPSFKNLIKKPAAELQALCISAIQKQIAELVAAEGADTRLELRLRDEMKQVAKIDTERADRKIGKYL